MMSVAIFLTNCDSNEEAQSIAEHLLVSELAAAVQVYGPACSRYRWHGALHTKLEWTLVVKTVESSETQVTAAIKALHSYDLPGILKLRADVCEPAYLRWIKDSVKVPGR